MADWLLEHYKKHLNLTFTDLTYGDALAGSRRLYKVLGELFEQYFHAIKPVKGEHMICGTGLSAVLDQLTDKLCDEGESILIARPYYSPSNLPPSSSCVKLT
jgi:1-aminocyclopropane-1-carboxylate synthase